MKGDHTLLYFFAKNMAERGKTRGVMEGYIIKDRDVHEEENVFILM